MIPKLYAPDSTTLLTWLGDTTICEVTEERNGIYELYMEIPTASAQFPLIENDCFIMAKPCDTGNDQLFRIYSVEKSMRGVAIVQGEHQSYALAAYPVDEVTTTNATATQAMSALLDRAASLLQSSHGFSAVSDITTTSNFAISAVSARAALGGTQGSVLQRYGGEFEFDGKIVRLHRARGRDSSIRIEYAKNLRALKASVSTEASFTGLFPFIKNEETLLFLPERILWVDNNSGVQRRVMVRDFTHDLGENATEERLRTAAESYLSANNINAPDISLDVDFVHMWQSPEYAQYADLERVALCDVVTVRHPDLGVDVSAKVIRTVYNTLQERYRRITVGSAKSNMAAVISGIRDELAELEAPDISGLQELINQAIEDATNAITGHSGGRVILNPPRNPQELLILTDANSTIQTAVRLWRWNAGGFGFSANGYNGPYRTAITADGQIAADFITTGILTANVIRAGILRSVNSTSFFDLDGNRIQTANATITGGSVSIGGSAWRTEIAAGTLSQYALGDGTFVCGLTPFSAGIEYRPTLFIGSNTRVTGFSISRQEPGTGNIINIAQFDKTKIDLINPVNTTSTMSVAGALTANSTLTVQGALTARSTLTANGLITSGTNSHLDLRGTSFISFLIGNTERGFFSSSGLNVTGAINTTGAITTNINSANTFAAVNHWRNVTGYGNAQVKFGCGTITLSGWAYASAAIEMGVGNYTTPAARLDVAPSPGAALIVLRGSSSGSNTGVLEMGTTTMWWRGSEIAIISDAKAKEDIAPAPSELEKINATGIYTYRFVGDDPENPVDDPQEHIGFVIGDEFASPPEEVIGEDGESINLYASIAMAWKGIQELSAENRELRQMVQRLAARVEQLEGTKNTAE